MNEEFELAYSFDLMRFDGMMRQKCAAEVAGYFADLKAAGINHVMLGGLHYEEKADFDFIAACREARKLLDRFELGVTSYHAWLPTLSPDSARREEIEAKTAATLEFVSILEPYALVLHPLLAGKTETGEAHFDDYFRAKQAHGLESVIENVVGNLRFVGEKAARYGLKLALENTGCFTPLGNRRHLPELVGRIGLDNVGYCLDAGHAHAFGEDVSEWIELAGDRLFETHFHDNRGNGAGLPDGRELVAASKEIDEHLPVGFGTVNWINVIRSLRKIGFSRPVTFETTGWPVGDEADGLKLAVKWWRTCEKIARETTR